MTTAILFVAIAVTLLPRVSRADDAYDVVIVGGGPSGYMAALSAKRNGAKSVLVVEKRPQGPSGRIQNLAIEKHTISELKRVGVDPESDPTFTQTKMFVLRAFDRADVRFPVDTDGIQRARAAGAGARTPGMFFRRHPTAIGPIDGVIDSLRNVAMATRGITILEGNEVTKLDVLPDGDSEVTMTPSASSSTGVDPAGGGGVIRGRYVYVAAGRRGTSELFGFERSDRGPKYPMLTVVLHNDDPSLAGKAVLTNRSLDGRPDQKYRLLMAGREENITITADIPLSVDRDDPDALKRFVVQAVERSGFVRPDAPLTFLSEPSVYDAQRSVLDRVLLGPKGRQRIMIGGDGLATTTPWSGLGFNLAIHTGALFGEFFGRAEAASTPRVAERVRRWVLARALGDVGMLHASDRLLNAFTKAPRLEGSWASRWQLSLKETAQWVAATSKPTVVLAGHGIRSLATVPGKPRRSTPVAGGRRNARPPMKP